MNVPKINGQSASESYELKAQQEEKMGNIPIV